MSCDALLQFPFEIIQGSLQTNHVRARALLDRWLSHDAHPALVEWKIALTMLEPDELAQFLESPTPRARRMRISSPFVGLVT